MAGMWVIHIDVTDKAGYAEYLKVSGGVVHSYGGEFIARAGRYDQREGRDYRRNVLVRFPTYERAVEAYESDEYQAIVGIATASSDRSFTIVETDA